MSWPTPPEVAEAPEDFLSRIGVIFAVYDHRTQDSGNVSYGVRVGRDRYFVKSAGNPGSGGAVPFPERSRLLRNAAALAASMRSPLLPRLHTVVECPVGPLLVYDWVDGELLYSPPEIRERPDSALSRLRRLPGGTVATMIGQVLELHAELARLGWVSSDFYDGCLIYDFSEAAMHVIDLDHYRRGPFRNEVGRLHGSRRFMAPEEFRVGAMIDHRTTVFHLGRLALELLGDGRRAAEMFRGTPAQFAAAVRATAPDPAGRFSNPRALHEAWGRLHFLEDRPNARPRDVGLRRQE